MSLQKSAKKKIVFILGYSRFNLFRDYLKETLDMTMKDISASASFINIDDIKNPIDLRDSVIIFICQPEIYVDVVKKVSRNNNVFILWIFEMFAPLPGEPKKKHKGATRFEICKRLLSKEIPADFIWSYCHKQILFFDSNNIMSYMPFGFNSKVFNCNQVKDNTQLLFYGSISGARKTFVKMLGQKDIKIAQLDSSGGINWITRKNELSRFKYSIDISVGDFYKDYISITRVISLFSAKVLLISHNNLEEIGFVDGVDYLHYDGVDSAIKVYNSIKNNPDKITNIVSSAYEKTRKNFNMANLLTAFFTKNGINI